jgi:hypothetical protein
MLQSIYFAFFKTLEHLQISVCKHREIHHGLVLEFIGVYEPLLTGAQYHRFLGSPVNGVAVYVVLLVQDVVLKQ